MTTAETPPSPDACPLAICKALQGPVDRLLSREWLLTNGRGGFASGTVIGCPTRKYHGWLIGARRPPSDRFLLLAGVIDRLRVGETLLDLATWEFNHGLEPGGYAALKEFDCITAAPDPWVQWTFVHGPIEVRRRLTMISDRPAIRVRYDVTAPASRRAVLEVAPLLAMRDVHGLRRQAAYEPWDTHSDGHWLWAQDRAEPDVTLVMLPRRGEGLSPARFAVEMVWWHNIRYRTELTREYLGGEDLQRTGTFRTTGQGSLSVEFVATGFATSPAEATEAADAYLAPPSEYMPARKARPDDPIRQSLVVATEAFVVRRAAPDQRDQATIIAGYPWFGDWGRDAFVSLEGLLLRTGRLDEACQVLRTFAGVQRNGLIPNRFDDYGGDCEYNSVDASLWFIHAADAYLAAGGAPEGWSSFIGPAARNIVDSFVAGTDHDIQVTDQGLLRCGNPDVQITWMDARCDGVVVTPRHGMPVEVNALWYHALRILEGRFVGDDSSMAMRCKSLADLALLNFERVFWNEDAGCLYDCVRGDERDASMRPNQVFAVSLAHSPLSRDRQAAVLESVGERLLTPYGLRSLAPGDPRYIGRYSGVRPVRDRAYHNGTVWSWLMGPFVEAHLRAHDFSADSKAQARRWLQPLLDHMGEACMGSISEVFDGDPPHAPRGCVAQAWSVAELLRIWDLIHEP